MDTTTNTTINSPATFSCSHSKQPVNNKRTRKILHGKVHFQHICNSRVHTNDCDFILDFLKFVVVVGRYAYCFWSCRQGGCSNAIRYEHNTDIRWTEEEDRTCQQELWLLSATVGRFKQHNSIVFTQTEILNQPGLIRITTLNYVYE